MARPTGESGSRLRQGRAFLSAVKNVPQFPFRLVSRPSPGVLAWKEGTVENLARTAYDERSLPAGYLDTDRLAVLADALEDAGCDNADIISHLRGPGPHVRGCWALDLVLDKK